MNKICGQTLDEILNPRPNIEEECGVENNYPVRPVPKNSSLEMANSLADNMISNLLFLSILAGNKLKL